MPTMSIFAVYLRDSEGTCYPLGVYQSLELAEGLATNDMPWLPAELEPVPDDDWVFDPSDWRHTYTFTYDGRVFAIVIRETSITMN